MKKEQLLKERLLREKARRDLYTFLKLKWERYNESPFMDNWHFRYLAKILSYTLPDFTDNDSALRGHSACSEFCGSALAHSLHRMPDTTHSLASHNPQNSSTILECQQDSAFGQKSARFDSRFVNEPSSSISSLESAQHQFLHQNPRIPTNSNTQTLESQKGETSANLSATACKHTHCHSELSEESLRGERYFAYAQYDNKGKEYDKGSEYDDAQGNDDTKILGFERATHPLAPSVQEGGKVGKPSAREGGEVESPKSSQLTSDSSTNSNAQTLIAQQGVNPKRSEIITPLICRKEKAEAFVFSGLRGEGGINPFSFCDNKPKESKNQRSENNTAQASKIFRYAQYDKEIALNASHSRNDDGKGNNKKILGFERATHPLAPSVQEGGKVGKPSAREGEINPQTQESDNDKILGFEMKKASFQSEVAGNYLNDSSKDSKILEEKSVLCRIERGDKAYRLSHKRDSNLTDFCPKAESTSKPNLITRLMLNMPPSYGKTELLARTFIAWALGRDRKRKFIYISYSDELCRKISNQVRDLMKSRFYQSIFGRIDFLQDNASEFVLKEGGGLFVTTLKSAITGFHAHQILIDDPIKVSEMSSKSARDLVNQNFKESVLSRLQDNKSNITILMQRLGDEDLCGFLLNPKYFKQDIINQWRIETLKAIESKPITYTIGDFSYTREANEPLFPARHNATELENLRLQMGSDEFSTQYLQEPMVSESGFFESAYFKLVQGYEIGEVNEYIFVDNATSTNTNADNRAIIAISVENIAQASRYIVKDCVYGIWEEAQTAKNIIDMALAYPKAKIYIESDGGGIALERILHQEIIKANTTLKAHYKPLIANQIIVYTPSRKLPKVDKIKAMKPFYNTGYLCFLSQARGLEQIKRELLSFNPSKPYRKDDCIDAIASAIHHSDVVPPSERVASVARAKRYEPKRSVWRI